MRVLNIAAFWMILTGLLSTIIDVIAKLLGEEFHPFQIMFFYCAIGALILLPFVGIRYGCNKHPWPSSIRWRYHIGRSIMEFIGFSLTFYSLTQLPLPMATAIGYMIPIFATLFAVWFLKETVSVTIAIGLIMGLVGVSIIHNPLAFSMDDSQSLGVIARLLSAVAFALCAICIKQSAKNTPPLLIAMIMLVFTAIVATPFALGVWIAPTPDHLVLLLALGASSAAVQYCVSRALHLGMITKLMPFAYLALVWASLFGYFLFDELISAHTIYGSVFIFGAVLVVSRKPKKTNVPHPNERQT